MNRLREAIAREIVRWRGLQKAENLGCRTSFMILTSLSDEELLSSLSKVCQEAREVLARLLVHLIEVENRRLELRSAFPSLFVFCTERLRMSEDEAVRRIKAARLLRKFPRLLPYIERGDLHLTALLLLRRHLTEESFDELVTAASGKGKGEIEALLAARAPRPDVFATITELPASDGVPASLLPAGTGAHLPAPAQATSAAPSLATATVTSARIEPLSSSRHRLELTISSETRAKLERVRDLLGHRIPDGNLEAVFDCALDAILLQLERTRLGKTTQTPRAKTSSAGHHAAEQASTEADVELAPAPAGEPASGRVSQEVRRQVFARDGEQCTFTDEHGNRCPCRSRLELDHVIPRACGGTDDVDNLRVRCRAHNRLYAEECFGRDLIERKIRGRQQKSAQTPDLPKPRDAAAPVPHPKLELIDQLRSGLRNLGYRDVDIRHAIPRLLPPDPSNPAPPIEQLIRSALRVLSP